MRADEWFALGVAVVMFAAVAVFAG